MKPYLIEILFFSTFLILTALRALVLAMRRRQLARRFSGVDADELVFHERNVSAFSDNALLCGLGASHTTLEIVLTRSELWLRGDLERSMADAERLCSIALSSIRSIGRQGKFIKIDFLGKNGSSDALLLRLGDRRGFLEQLNALVLPSPALPHIHLLVRPLRLFRRSATPAAPVEP